MPYFKNPTKRRGRYWAGWVIPGMHKKRVGVAFIVGHFAPPSSEIQSALLQDFKEAGAQQDALFLLSSLFPFFFFPSFPFFFSLFSLFPPFSLFKTGKKQGKKRRKKIQA